ncbi:peptide deformylase [Shewanella glacialipiscicola]|uniref:Peptide deformylase n=1 Tax=Shewanella glacialipiscicola TaxID=614069 RepID=A0ABQ6IZP8_9GAMM|nr:peptide deformylase [Shewanella glacialipiscicola]MCL1086981.1 peptide deformylase [Shewanella glacialipiscicola]GIU15927.1 peptide deformylase 2 [Shewanella glacialipiscicola]GMA80969.1 peptide deformylase 2 [Shewanella glacialipiscicola]
MFTFLRPTPSALLPIALVGEDILKQQAIAVQHFDAALTELAQQMSASMAAAQGVGIAAPQVHSPLALFIMASRPNERYPDAPNMAPVVVVNPHIIHVSSDLVSGEEGCLSVPGQRFIIQRHKTIEVRYQNLQGEWQQAELTDFIARIFQHEFDHLQGITLLERSRMPEQTHTLSAQPTTVKGEAQ